LPENIRQAFVMNRFKDMTYDQIAGKMQISSKTVESYISKALVLLRIELKDYFPLFLLFCQFLRDLR
jgi:DNA-directed RNA polymerase specialized sigma24 family protein